MKIYLAGQDVESANQIATRLGELGHEVVSTWHAPCAGEARRDISQIDVCDLLVAVLSRDGLNQYLEMGYATGRSKKVVAISRGGKLQHPSMASRFTVFNEMSDLERWISSTS